MRRQFIITRGFPSSNSYVQFILSPSRHILFITLVSGRLFFWDSGSWNIENDYIFVWKFGFIKGDHSTKDQLYEQIPRQGPSPPTRPAEC